MTERIGPLSKKLRMLQHKLFSSHLIPAALTKTRMEPKKGSLLGKPLSKLPSLNLTVCIRIRSRHPAGMN